MCAWFLLLAPLAVPPTILVQRLDHRDFHTREAAGKELEALGEAAVPPLKHILATGSPEAVRRAESLLRRITVRVENETAIAPKLVTLDFRDAEFAVVADEIRKQTGYWLEVPVETVVRQTGAELDNVADERFTRK